MISAILFAATLVGVFYPRFVMKQKAFGVSVVLVIAALVADVIGVSTSWLWIQMLQKSSIYGGILHSNAVLFILMAIAPFLKVVAAILLLVAYWPGGTLYKIRQRLEGNASQSTDLDDE